MTRNPMAAKGLLRHSSANTTLIHYIKEVPEVAANGMAQWIALDVSGHKTRAVFDRYNIVNEHDLRDAAQKLSRYLSR
jgi:hypothetical protein